ncbi:hypothetical protein [Saccharopolyspora dendranthemae]|uniref:hypothetical protein n=1 Tax=Saccharopolyspora dendranthemae TaxID=1181886 RepID=UPI00119F7152|nr:hypothetical protein [Saccharopolyspora dendranthemae]
MVAKTSTVVAGCCRAKSNGLECTTPFPQSDEIDSSAWVFPDPYGPSSTTTGWALEGSSDARFHNNRRTSRALSVNGTGSDIRIPSSPGTPVHPN